MTTERPLLNSEPQGPLTTLCPDCKGEGWEDNPPMRKCGKCKGTGRIEDHRSKFIWEAGDLKIIKENDHDH